MSSRARMNDNQAVAGASAYLPRRGRLRRQGWRVDIGEIHGSRSCSRDEDHSSEEITPLS